MILCASVFVSDVWGVEFDWPWRLYLYTLAVCPAAATDLCTFRIGGVVYGLNGPSRLSWFWMRVRPNEQRIESVLEYANSVPTVLVWQFLWFYTLRFTFVVSISANACPLPCLLCGDRTIVCMHPS